MGGAAIDWLASTSPACGGGRIASKMRCGWGLSPHRECRLLKHPHPNPARKRERERSFPRGAALSLALGRRDGETVELVAHLDLARQPRVRAHVETEIEHVLFHRDRKSV